MLLQEFEKCRSLAVSRYGHQYRLKLFFTTRPSCGQEPDHWLHVSLGGDLDGYATDLFSPRRLH